MGGGEETGEEEGGEAGRTGTSREGLAKTWEKLRRVQSIEALEKMLTEPKQIADPID